MGKLNFSIHPLFFIFGLYFAATGKVFSFLVFTLSAVVHEFGHALAAEKRGYKLNKVVLMPYGAIIKGDLAGIGYKDEIKVVAAGPAVNLAIYLAIVASWWTFPETYPYTELAATANLGLFLVNLVPAYPLDGGRFLLATLSLFLKRKTAILISRAAGIIFSLVLFSLFIYSCFTQINITILFFAAFAFFGAVGGKAESSYERITLNSSAAGIKKYKEIKTIAVSENSMIKDLYAAFDGESLYRIFVYDERGKAKRIIEPEEIEKLFSEKSASDKIA